MLIINWKKEKNIFDQPEGGERKHLMMKITQVDQKLFNLINPAGPSRKTNSEYRQQQELIVNRNRDERNIIMTRENNQAFKRIVI